MTTFTTLEEFCHSHSIFMHLSKLFIVVFLQYPDFLINERYTYYINFYMQVLNWDADCFLKGE